MGLNVNHFKMAAVGEAVDEDEETQMAVVAASRYGLAYAYASDLDASGWNWKDIYPSSSYATHIWFNCVLYDDEKFIIAGQNGGIAYSDPALDLSNWNIDTSFTWLNGNFNGYYINGLAFNTSTNNMYVATGGDSFPLASRTPKTP
jgi:hypothetical protein